MFKMPSPEELAAMAAAQPQQMAMQIATPLNDIQLVTLAATNIFRSTASLSSPKQAVEQARQIFTEAVVAETRKTIRAEVQERLQPSERTNAGDQFVIPGTR